MRRSVRITAHRNPALQRFEMHLKSVAQIVSSVSHDEETIVAAWPHDIVEDTGVTIGDVERMFGAKVAGLVGELTFVSHPTRGNRLGTKRAAPLVNKMCECNFP
jgi:(p)ppGpp synthase/HD superfamily hydrolase